MLSTVILQVLLLRSLAVQEKQCHSISKAASDAWCQKNCNWNPSYCPASLCKCGGAPSPPGPGPLPPVPSPSPASPDAPLSPEAAVKYLNDFYLGFDENNSKSPIGVTMTMTTEAGTFYGNIFCSTFANPHGKTSCWNGFADCRLSASLYNHKMIVDEKSHKIILGLRKTTGYVLNQTRVEAYWSKCSYIWDGATENRLNRGCGLGTPTQSCADRRSAFYNICPSTGQTCTFNDDEVKRALCTTYGGTVQISSDPSQTCVFPGPAIDWHNQAEYDPLGSYLRDMANARVAHNGQNTAKWNEIVIDETLLLHDIGVEPTQVVTAFVYAKSAFPASKSSAEKMRDDYCKHSGIAQIPVIEIDDVTYQPDGPFKVPSAESIVIL